jgi:hypothetical protein|tara:strand:- start:121 stop:414 length:294 start_codon:yes stop_codon:yes gene_type:complete
MAKIINFPNSPKSEAQKQAEALELKKITIENTLITAMSSSIWEHYQITAEDIECLEQFGEVMVFPPDVAARLITKLANQNKKLADCIQLQFADEPWS